MVNFVKIDELAKMCNVHSTSTMYKKARKAINNALIDNPNIEHWVKSSGNGGTSAKLYNSDLKDYVLQTKNSQLYTLINKQINEINKLKEVIDIQQIKISELINAQRSLEKFQLNLIEITSNAISKQSKKIEKLLTENNKLTTESIVLNAKINEYVPQDEIENTLNELDEFYQEVIEKLEKNPLQRLENILNDKETLENPIILSTDPKKHEQAIEELRNQLKKTIN